MQSLEQRFYSNPTAYTLMYRGLVFTLGALIIAATVFGQIKGGRFAAYWDLAISLLLPFGTGLQRTETCRL